MPDDLVAWRDLAVRYPYQERDAVGPVTLSLRRGERLLLLGPSGAGKSTLLATVNGLVPNAIPATVAGSVKLAGRDATSRSPAEWSDTIAWLHQDAEQTLCGMSVADEIAFALENRRLPEDEIGRRVEDAMQRTGIPVAWHDRRTATLSGGERQLVALAATLAQDAPLFIADEPTAHLAPEAAARLRTLLLEPRDDRGVLVVDHRLDGLIGDIDRVAVLDAAGRLFAEDAPRRLFRTHGADLAARGIWRPAASGLDEELSRAGITLDVPPLSVDEALRAVDALGKTQRIAAASAIRSFVAGRCISPAPVMGNEPLVRLTDAACAPLFGPVVLRGITLEVRSGECLAILGRNGAGKSTLSATLAGLLRLLAGRRDGPPGGMAFQNPESQLMAGSVREEIADALGRTVAKEKRFAQADQLLADWGLAGLERRHPFELSAGQKRRLALLALVAADRWPLLVLDEPTAGLDAAGVEALSRRLHFLAQGGRALAVVTHDMDFALKTCTRAVLVGDGGILGDRPMIELARDAALLRQAGLEEPATMPALRWLEEHAPC
ncbi:ATP-binding cassette domain-containing protein [Mesorhizobium australicum]|uniref:Energy-coupling factor transport system ATP-binding protein n=1 Tax=Mesorhizobium australicum TaxID=536018 RepID=A0A1X7PPC7_9HYPH|nr:ATP-binding cassette domain-containing protein [Mesorhizobium australicum]SMH53531.1 energy-coupling factor transport system ATP-binding protein [Mesorhizobium australicum]